MTLIYAMIAGILNMLSAAKHMTYSSSSFPRLMLALFIPAFVVAYATDTLKQYAKSDAEARIWTFIITLLCIFMFKFVMIGDVAYSYISYIFGYIYNFL